MALLFFDSCDHMGTTQANVTAKYSSTGTMAPATAAARTGTHGYLINAGGLLISKTLPASGGAVVGFAMRWTASFNNTTFFDIRESTTPHLALGIDATGHLQVKLGASVLGTSATALSLNSFYYIELKTVIHDSAGTYEVHVDGVQDAALTATGQDTRNGGTGTWDNFRFVNAVNGQHLDDIYACDTSGSAPRNTFLGVVKVECLFPQTDATAAGSNATLTPSTGTDHGALVDETSPNTTDYNASANVGDKDTYNYPSMSLSGTVLGVQTNLYVVKTDAAARTVCAVVRSGGTDYDGANVSPQTSYTYQSTVFAQNPDTAADWTSSEVNALEAGMKVTA